MKVEQAKRIVLARATQNTNTALLLASLVALAACDRRPEATTTPQPPADTGSTTSAPQPQQLGFAERAPDSIFMRRGACPFECCTYREWALEKGGTVRERTEPQAPPAFTLAPNQRFKADSGFVRITSRALIVVHDTVDQRPYAKLFLPGDTLVVLDHVGEGHFNVWDGQRVLDVEGFWGAEQPGVPKGSLEGNYEREWWVHVTHENKQGWLLVETALGRLINADACGAPPPGSASIGQKMKTGVPTGTCL